MSFPRYPKYKDSGVEWVGEVPTHWNRSRIKHVARSGDKTFVDGDWIEAPYITSEGVRLLQCGNVGTGVYEEQGFRYVSEETFSRLNCTEVEPNDILICRLQSSRTILAGRACLAPQLGVRMITSVDNCIVKPSSEFDPRYVVYQLSTSSYLSFIEVIARGGTRDRISRSMLGDIELIAPPVSEQIMIASFLDRETAKIDELVAEQRRLIELLKEKRQAVISHAVTKGLNPLAPMKPSGIEWLGEVPEHWEVGRVKNYFHTCSGGTPDTTQQGLYYTEEGGGVPWVRTTDLQNDVLRSVEVFITDRALADTACSVLPPGTVMVAMYGGDGTVGKNGLLAIPAAINQAVCGLLPSITHNSEFVFRFMQFYRPYWMIGAESSRKDPNISQERVRNAPFPRPPIDEQVTIVNFLETQLREFDALTAEAQRAIDLLQERRTALISAAVTGKIDVRGLAATEAF
jgi:type I restriction enzyme S subunit